MNLKGKVAATHRVKKVEADGELFAEARVDRLTQQFARMLEHEIDGGDLDFHVPEAQKQAILCWHAVKAPGVVWSSLGREPTDFFHPVAAPGSGVKVRNNAKRPVGRDAQAFPQCVARNHFRCVRIVRIEQKIDLVEKLLLESISSTPVHKVGALVLH